VSDSQQTTVHHEKSTADVAAGFSKYCWHYTYNMGATNRGLHASTHYNDTVG